VAATPGLGATAAAVDTRAPGEIVNTERCLKIARRIDGLLRVELGCGIDPQRMRTDALYARDVLLVCDAHPSHELADLAREYRSAASAPAEGAAEVPTPSGWGTTTSGFVASLFDAWRTVSSSGPSGPSRRGAAWYSPSRWRR
jgi:hypothetical protein